jgi:hypothetical protein
MTRERLVDHFVSAALKRAVTLRGQKFVGGFSIVDAAGDAADAILAEMAGEWNAACTAISERLRATHGSPVSVSAFERGRTSALLEAAAIADSLRCPDAAPEGPTPELRSVHAAYLDNERRRQEASRPATPSVEEVARAIDPIAMAAPSQDDPWVLRRGVARERAVAVITLFAKERL